MSLLRDFSPQQLAPFVGPYATVDAVDTLFGDGAVYFAGANYFAYPSDYAGHQIQSGDFTIDGWARWEGLAPGQGNGVIVGKAASTNQSYYLYVMPTNKLAFAYSTNGNSAGVVNIVSSNSITANAWLHFEVTRSGSALYLFLNGTLEATATLATSFFNSTDPLQIGRINVSGFEYFWKGNLRDIRITKGAARHTASFTPPTASVPTDSSDPNYSNTTCLLPLKTTYVHTQVGLRRIYARQSPPFNNVSFKQSASLTNLKDVYFGGRGSIIGTVKEKASPANVPLHRRVWLMRERDGAVIREVWSDPVTGAYAFTNVDETQRYSVLTFDYLRNHRAVIADNLPAEV